LIEVSGLSVRRGQATILESYTFSLTRGGVLAILGANGVGKTTLLHTIIGILKPEVGIVSLDGRVGFVAQLFDIAFDYKVIDVALMGRARHIGLFGSPSTRDFDAVHRFLDLLGIRELEERSFNSLSGGQRQLVMIAQALSSECELLVLDEPCGALDYKNQAIVIAMLQALSRDHGISVIFTTHAPQHALEIASHVLLMRDRSTYHFGTMQKHLTAENLSALYGVPIASATFSDTGGQTLAPRFLRAGQGAAVA